MVMPILQTSMLVWATILSVFNLLASILQKLSPHTSRFGEELRISHNTEIEMNFERSNEKAVIPELLFHSSTTISSLNLLTTTTTVSFLSSLFLEIGYNPTNFQRKNTQFSESLVCSINLPRRDLNYNQPEKVAGWGSRGGGRG
ncbi:hypothetical protein NC652_038761 [Populus alba x Populus x berolinensis]|nr:hypothetical protein NC652_038761 [Populus alba x Populus x berolinensis]